jgi:hypothetical protein
MIDFKNNRDKDLDLVLCTPAMGDASSGMPTWQQWLNACS